MIPGRAFSFQGLMQPPIGPVAGQVTQDAFRIGVEIDVSDLAGRLQREAMRLINDLSQQGLTGDALADAVSDGLLRLSPNPVNRIAQSAGGESFNLGRNLEAQRRPDEIGEVVRSEVMDQNTCQPCADLDGRVFQMNTDEYLEFMPPNKCDGREQCRGFYIYRSAA